MDDPNAWTVYAGADEPIEHTWTDGTLLFTGTASEEITYQTHVWQAFEVEAGSYRFAAEISGGGDGFNNAYLEFLIGRSEPVDGENYSPRATSADGVHPDNGKVASINFWQGCGTEEARGDIIDLGCDPQGLASVAAGENSTNGIITFHEAGTYYFVIKADYWNGSMGPGMSVLNVSLAPVDE